MAWRLKFWRKTAKKLPDPIECGQTWRLRSAYHDESPWPKVPPTNDYGYVVVLDVRSGWVRYVLGTCFPDERMKEATFRYCYELVKNDNVVLHSKSIPAEIGARG